jgi:hypothetical protein
LPAAVKGAFLLTQQAFAAGNEATTLTRIDCRERSRQAMGDFRMVSEEDLAQARRDPAFRNRLLTKNLEHLLDKLNRLRKSPDAAKPDCARQIRDGVQLAVKLADLLRVEAQNGPSRAA